MKVKYYFVPTTPWMILTFSCYFSIGFIGQIRILLENQEGGLIWYNNYSLLKLIKVDREKGLLISNSFT